MPFQHIYNRLLELPLFQGMSRGDLETVAEHTRFNIVNIAEGRAVVRDGDTCNSLVFLMRGTMCAESVSDDRKYCLAEEIQAPDLIQPERLFGLTQRYTRTFRAATDCEFLCISKQEAMRLSHKFEIFRLNLLNILCTQTQKTARNPWRKHPQDIRGKIARFIETRCSRPAGKKTLYIKMEQLGQEINESRLNVSRELNAMNSEGVISLKRGEIYVPALERLLMQSGGKDRPAAI